MPAKKKSKCTVVTYKKNVKNGKLLPPSQWTTVERCSTRKLARSAKTRWTQRQKSTATRACRRGGTGPLAHLFVKCGSRTHR